MDRHLFCFGFGYLAKAVSKHVDATERHWVFSGTKRVVVNEPDVKIYSFESMLSIPKDVTHILISIPPKDEGDIVLSKFAKHITKLKNLQWIGYISTTGVYGDTKGEWVDEESPINPSNPFAKRRILAEQQWHDLCEKYNIPLVIFRVSGIYGPGRSSIETLLADKAHIIDKPDQVFSRIHIDDIAHIVHESIEQPEKYQVYNLADDYPCNPKEVTEFACSLINIAPPQPVKLEDANLSEMGKVFYSECKRVSNKKVKDRFKIKLKYPTYKEGLVGIMNS